MIFTNQTYLRIELDTKMDLSGASAQKIKYKKPDGTVGEWTATIDGTKVIYTFGGGTSMDMEGEWILQPEVTIDGKLAPGDKVTVRVYKPITA